MGYYTALSVGNFIAEITLRYHYLFTDLSMKQIQQALTAPMNDIDPFIHSLYKYIYYLWLKEVNIKVYLLH